MAVNKEWRCGQHGDFEGTHPICPHYGCFSENVERVFITPVSVSRGQYGRFDKGLRRTSEMMNIPNWKTAREGEVAFAGRAPLGSEVLWGDEVKKHPDFGGRGFSQLMQTAAQPLTVAGKDSTDPYLTHNNGMRSTATELGITASTLPKAEITSSHRDRAVV